MRKSNVDLEGRVILITGAAGFIGSNLAMDILRNVHPVTIVGIDNMNDYYDVSIKEWRLQKIKEIAAGNPPSSFEFIKSITFSN